MNSVKIRYVRDTDREFWFSLDKHLPASEFTKKVRDKQGYILTVDGKSAGILRYNLFWDNTPFCTLLYIDEKYRSLGYGRLLMAHWEDDMRAQGFDFILTSTQSDEDAQHFYRKLGYSDCGSLTVPNQADELLLSKNI